jgi:hypothetical protein
MQKNTLAKSSADKPVTKKINNANLFLRKVSIFTARLLKDAAITLFRYYQTGLIISTVGISANTISFFPDFNNKKNLPSQGK